MSFRYSISLKFYKSLSLVNNFFARKKINSRGISFYLYADNWITNFRAKTFNTKEIDTLNWIDYNLEDGDVLFDIGSNIGIYSIYAFKKKNSVKIFSFEPEYSNLDQLKKNIILNKAESAIIPYSLALGNVTDLSFLNLQDLTPGSALHTESITNINQTKTNRKIVFKEGISCYKLDDFIQRTKIFPNLIKIDVDGNEINVLEGSKQTLRNKNLKTILIEVDIKSDEEKIQKILHDSNFIFVSSSNENQIWSRE